MNKLTISALTVSLALTAGSAFAGDHWKDKFDAADTNKDGALSMAEWNAESNEMFNTLDTNKDGKVTWEEKKAHKQDSHDKVTDAKEHPNATKKLNPDNTPPAEAKNQ